MADAPTMVTLPTLPHESFDLAKLNAAMDAILEEGSEARGRYALVHAHRWAAGDAVEYSRAAQSCFDNGIDPNTLGE